MAKNRRKPSAAQRERLNIDIAKYLKSVGIISKQAKLHGGHYISPTVLKRVREHTAAAKLNYTSVKVNKAIARAAKERGFQVVQGNRIIGPKTPIFRKRLQAGAITGVRPIKGGMMEELILPHTIYDLRTLINALGKDGIDTLKLPEEHFAFKYKGAESYRSFRNSKQLLDYLTHYVGIDAALKSNKTEDMQEQFNNLVIFRLHPYTVSENLPSVRERRDRRAMERAEAIRNGNYVIRRTKPGKSFADRLANMPDWKAAKIRAAKAAKAKAYRNKLTGDDLAKYRAKAAARAKISRERNK
jgi:hypothetical protein